MKIANLTLRFLLELCAIVALSYWGFQTGSGPLRLILGFGTPLLFVIIWGALVAPRTWTKLPNPLKFTVGLVLLETAAVALGIAGQPILAAIFGAVVLINAILIAVWKQYLGVGDYTSISRLGERGKP